MTRFGKSFLILSSVASLGTGSPTFADDDSGLYLGLSASRLSADFEDDNDVSFDDSDTAPGARIGYMTNDFLGFELAYLDLGDFSATGETASGNINVDADAFTAAVVLKWQLHDQIDIYGKGGAMFIDANANSNIAGVQIDADDSSTEPFGAIGIEADLGNWNAFGELSKVDTDINDLTIDIATIGVKYEFGR